MSKNKEEVLKKVEERPFNQKETMQWIMTNPLWVMSWGAREFTTYKDTVLFFRVSGRKHNGFVLITLAWDDTYIVRLFSTQWNEKAKFENVYCDDLTEIIDEHIERIKEYNK